MAIRKRAWKTPSGAAREAWVVDYADATGKRRLKTFTTQGAAKAWLATAAYEVRQGIHTPASVSKSGGKYQIAPAPRLKLSAAAAAS